MDNTKTVELNNNNSHINELVDDSMLDMGSPKNILTRFLNGADEVQEDDVYIEEGFPDDQAQEQAVESLGNEHYQIFQTPHITIHLFIPVTIVQDGQTYQIGDLLYYDEKQVFHIGSNQIKVPDHSEVGLNEHELILGLGSSQNEMNDDFDRLVIDYKDSPVRLGFNEYLLNLDKTTHVFVDELGNLAFNYGDEIAVLNLYKHFLKCGYYRIDLMDVDRQLSLKGKWIKLQDKVWVNGRDGILQIDTNKVKIPWNTLLTVMDGHMAVQVWDEQMKKNRTLDLACNNRRIRFSNSEASIQMKKDSHVYLDKQANLAFELDGKINVMNLCKRQFKGNNLLVKLSKGAQLRVAGKGVELQEGMRLYPSKRLLNYNRSKWLLPKKTILIPTEDNLEINVKHKAIYIMPYNKQIFIRVGGKLVIVTVTVAVAVDQNGNLAFDYNGNLATLDTNLMVLNIDDVKLSMGKAKGVAVEVIGNQVIVSAEDQQQSFLEMLKALMQQKGLLQLLEQTDALQISPEELIELLMNTVDPEELIKMLQSLGVNVEQNVIPVLMQMFGQKQLSELLKSIGQGQLDPMLWLSVNGASQPSVRCGGQAIMLPTSQEMIEQLSVSGGAATILAKIKNKEIQLQSIS